MDLTKTMVCPKCGNVVMVTDQFCSKCFERLERPAFWRRIGAWFKSAFKPGVHTLVLKKNVRLETIDKQSVKHAYHSLDEVPPEYRGAFEKLQSEMDAKAQSQSSDVSKDAPQEGTIIRKNFQEFRFKDASGNEQVYHSLDEMPPETRALIEKLRGRLNLPE